MKKQNHGIRIIVSIMSALLLLAALSSCPAPIAAVQPATPAAPVIAAGNNQITVSWTAVSNATRYEVWYNIAASTESAAKFGSDVTSTSTVVTGLANGTAYYVWVRAKNSALASGFSPSACAIAGFYFTTPPTLAVGDGQLDVSWSALTDATAYEVWYGVSSSPTAAVKFGGDVTGTSATITGLTNGIAYYVWINAKQPLGKSGFSPSGNARPFAASGLTMNTWYPGNLIAGQEKWYSFDAVSGRSYSIYWDDGYNGSGSYTCYALYVSAYHADRSTAYFTDYSYGYSSPQTISATATETVYIKVKGSSTSVAGTFAVKASIPGPGTPTLVPGTSQIDVSWTALTGATAYEVWYNTTNNVMTAVQFGGDVAGTSSTITGLTNGTRYYIWIRAKVTEGYTNFSNSSDACPFIAQTLTFNTWTPGSLTANGEQWYSFDASASNSYKISWDDAYNGSGAYTCNYTYVSAYRANRSTAYFTNAYSYGSPQTISATASETVYIKVKGSSSSVTGTYAVKASIPGPNTPTLAPGNGLIDVSWSALTGATSYEVWFNTSNNVATATQFGGDIVGNSTSITSLTNGTTYYIWVRAKIAAGYTDYSSPANARPFIAQALTFNVWTPGTLAAGGEQWYSFDAVAGKSYKITWDDAYNGSGAYTCNRTNVSAYRANRATAYFTDSIYGYTSPLTISATASETVYIKVKGNSSLTSGTFAVKTSIPGPNTPTLAPGNGFIDVSWLALTGATSYEVWFNTSNNVTSATQSGGDITGTSTSITGLTSATTYYVWVRAKIAAGYTDYSSSANARPFIAQALTFNVWAPGSLAAGSEQWYSFDAVAGNSYKIYWDDAYHGSGSYTCYYTYVSAYRANRSTAYFTDYNSYSSGSTIAATASETVYIKVKGTSSSVSGTFAVKASIPGPNTPTLAPGNGLIDVSWSALAGATAYEVWYGTANNVATAAQSGGDIAGTSASITGLTNATTYYVWVRAKIAAAYTEFSSSANARPFIAQALTFNVWSPGSLTAGSEQWYSFAASAGKSYKISWDDGYNGSGAYTCYYTYVSAYRANRSTAYFTDYNNGYSSPRTIAVTASETVYIKVKGTSSSVSGTFAVKASLPGPGTPTLAPGNGLIDVSWTAVTGATAYEVWYNSANNIATATQSGGDIVGTSTSITGLTNGTTYYVWVRAKVAEGYTDFCASAGITWQSMNINLWTAGSLGAYCEYWYAFNGVSGTAYNVYWDDQNNGSGVYSCTVRVSAYHADRTTAYFTSQYNGYSSPRALTAAATETVYLRIAANSSGSQGTFAVKAVAAGPAAPVLTFGNGQIDVTWNAIPTATAYEVWYGTVNSPSSAGQFGGDIAGTSTSITGLTNGVRYYVWVRAKISGGTTDFSPSANAIPNIVNILTLSVWTPGNLTAGGELWYSFTALVGTTYQIYWDDSYSGSGAYTCDVMVSAYHSDRTNAYFTSIDSAYSTPRTITPSVSEVVYLKVAGLSSSYSGTFAVRVAQQ